MQNENVQFATGVAPLNPPSAEISPHRSRDRFGEDVVYATGISGETNRADGFTQVSGLLLIPSCPEPANFEQEGVNEPESASDPKTTGYEYATHVSADKDVDMVKCHSISLPHLYMIITLSDES
jgi:hypothetical protein